MTRRRAACILFVALVAVAAIIGYVMFGDPAPPEFRRVEVGMHKAEAAEILGINAHLFPHDNSDALIRSWPHGIAVITFNREGRVIAATWTPTHQSVMQRLRKWIDLRR